MISQLVQWQRWEWFSNCSWLRLVHGWRHSNYSLICYLSFNAFNCHIFTPIKVPCNLYFTMMAQLVRWQRWRWFRNCSWLRWLRLVHGWRHSKYSLTKFFYLNFTHQIMVHKPILILLSKKCSNMMIKQFLANE